jgi:metallo-beta-lactamase family protein
VILKTTFMGAAGTVTGSKYLVESGDTRIMVDCGLYQGVKVLRQRNREPLGVRPSELSGVVLTHAHLDHSGYLPALVRDGFEGRIYCTPPTAGLGGILLPDSGYIQEEDARYANRRSFSKHAPALPLYTQADAERVDDHFVPLELDEEHRIGALRFRFSSAGHILGAASVWVSDGQRSVLFSGDLGREDDLLMQPPDPPPTADYVVIESTYGDRTHERVDPIEFVAGVVTRTIERGGVVLIPSFAVGRAQAMLYCLHEVFERGRAPRVPVYVNSPMATSVTDLYRRHADYHRLEPELCDRVCDVAQYTRSVEESKRLVENRRPSVIISASGMATGGRVLHHLRALAPDSRNTILLPGFQAPSTRGDAIARGVEAVKIHGAYVPIKAEVVQIDAFSAHADQPGLLAWLRRIPARPKRVFVTHGEPVASDALRLLIQDELGFDAGCPEYRQTVELR